MFNLLKGHVEPRQAGGGGDGSAIAPPKVLPELARDMYEHDKTQAADQATTAINSSTTQSNSNPVDNTASNNTNASKSSATTLANSLSEQIVVANSPKPIAEPSLDSVPHLDLSLLKQHIAGLSESSAGTSTTASTIQAPTVQAQMIQAVQTPAIQTSAHDAVIPAIPITVPSEIHASVYNNSKSIAADHKNSHNARSVYQDMGALSHESIHMIDDSTGFFKEFEEHIKSNGLNNDIIADLLDKNLLDHMMFYHSSRGSDMPFYASSPELTHAIKLKLEELQNMERNWISNKQKMDLLKRVGSSMESDIHVRSEELKKLLGESRKRSIGNGSLNTGMNAANGNYISNMAAASKTAASDTATTASTTSSVYTNETPITGSAIYADTINDTIHDEILGHIDDDIIDDASNKDALDANSSHTTPGAVQAISHDGSNKPLYIGEDAHDSMHKNNGAENMHERGLHISLSDGLHIVSDDSKGFYLSDGVILRSLPQLVEAIADMDEATFSRYVNDSKNDFANWIMHVFGDKVLAGTVRSARDKYQLLHVLKSYLDI